MTVKLPSSLLNYKELNIDEIVLHITPKENYESIKEYGLLIPNEVYKITHTSPYDIFETSKMHKNHPSRSIKNKYIRFGRASNASVSKTFIQWFYDSSCINNCKAFIHKNFINGFPGTWSPFFPPKENESGILNTGYSVPYKDLVDVDIINDAINPTKIPKEKYVIFIQNNLAYLLVKNS